MRHISRDRASRASRITPGRALNLHHIRAEVGKQLATIRCGNTACHFQHFSPGERRKSHRTSCNSQSSTLDDTATAYGRKISTAQSLNKLALGGDRVVEQRKARPDRGWKVGVAAGDSAHSETPCHGAAEFRFKVFGKPIVDLQRGDKAKLAVFGDYTVKIGKRVGRRYLRVTEGMGGHDSPAKFHDVLAEPLPSTVGRGNFLNAVNQKVATLGRNFHAAEDRESGQRAQIVGPSGAREPMLGDAQAVQS